MNTQIEEDLEKLKWDLLAQEEITKEDLELVDLDIQFTPVIPCKNDTPHEVIETVGGGYLIVNHPMFQHAITAEELKVMRYRYLINRNK